jgi:hypothetical protein
MGEIRMRRAWATRWAIVAVWMLGSAGCLSSTPSDIPEYMGRGPRAEEMFYARVASKSDREPSFDEKRQFKDLMDEKVFKYLREHPEMEQQIRYSEFRFWRQVAEGSTPGEVRTLLDEPVERTIDPARMGAMAKVHWPDLRVKAKEAWLYPMGWIIYFDDKGVVSMLRRPQPGFLVVE